MNSRPSMGQPLHHGQPRRGRVTWETREALIHRSSTPPASSLSGENYPLAVPAADRSRQRSRQLSFSVRSDSGKQGEMDGDPPFRESLGRGKAVCLIPSVDIQKLPPSRLQPRPNNGSAKAKSNRARDKSGLPTGLHTVRQCVGKNFRNLFPGAGPWTSGHRQPDFRSSSSSRQLEDKSARPDPAEHPKRSGICV